MPPHLWKRKGSRNWYIIDGNQMFSTKTDNHNYASQLLSKYITDRLGLSQSLKLNHEAKAAFEKFGPPDITTNIRRLRFPCVYAFIRDGEIVYVGMSVNGFARVLDSSHPMVDNDSDNDDLVVWVFNSEGEARDTEIRMIRHLKPRVNFDKRGSLVSMRSKQKAASTRQLNTIKKITQDTIREELGKVNT